MLRFLCVNKGELIFTLVMNEDVLTTLAIIVVSVTLGCFSSFKKISVAAIDG